MSEGHTSIIFASFFMTAMNAITPSNLNSSWSNRQSKVCSFLDRNDFQRSSTSDRTLMSSKKFKKFRLLGKILRNPAKNLGWNGITTFLFFFKCHISWPTERNYQKTPCDACHCTFLWSEWQLCVFHRCRSLEHDGCAKPDGTQWSESDNCIPRKSFRRTRGCSSHHSSASFSSGDFLGLSMDSQQPSDHSWMYS